MKKILRCQVKTLDTFFIAIYNMIMEKVEERVYLSKLLSIYGELLTDYQKEVFTLYNDDDISLSDIASINGVSRQSINDLIVKVTEKLIDFEKKLHILKDYDYLKNDLLQIKNLVSNNTRACELIDKLLKKSED